MDLEYSSYVNEIKVHRTAFISYSHYIILVSYCTRHTLSLFSTMSSDTLRTIRNAFYLGQFKHVIKEAKTVKDSKENANAADVFYYRSLIAMGCEDQVIKGVNNNSPFDLQAVKLLAAYNTMADDNKDIIYDAIKEWSEKDKLERKQNESNSHGNGNGNGNGNGTSGTGTWQLIASIIYYSSNNYSEALKYIVDFHENLEMFF